MQVWYKAEGREAGLEVMDLGLNLASAPDLLVLWAWTTLQFSHL